MFEKIVQTGICTLLQIPNIVIDIVTVQLA